MASRKAKRHKSPLIQIINGITASLATLNLGLVIFDLSYLPLRDFWLTGELPLIAWNVPAPSFVLAYDRVKGVDENPEVQRYLDELDTLRQMIRDTGLRSPEASRQVQTLQTLSLQMLEDDPFLLADRDNILETIKNRMRGRMQTNSSEDAITQFWTVDYLAQSTPNGEDTPLAWFNTSVRPFMEKGNYIRTIGPDGFYINNFWRIDLVFQLFFAGEFIVRTFSIKQRYNSLTWREAALWRWYDLILLLPFWRWLRVVPVAVRLQKSDLLDFETIRSQFSRGFVATFAGELVEVIAIQVINQVQGAVRRGDIVQWLSTSTQREYIDLNNTNEIEIISKRLAELMVYRVLPQLQPDITALLQRNAELALSQSPLYQTLTRLPGMAVLPAQVTQNLVEQISSLITQVSQSTYNMLTLDDPTLAQITEQLSAHFRHAFTEALQSQETLTELQSLITDLLEEVKVNYVSRLSEEDFDQLLEEAERLKRQGA